MKMSIADQNIEKFISVDWTYQVEGKEGIACVFQVLSNLQQKWIALLNRLAYVIEHRFAAGSWMDNQAVAKKIEGDVEYLTTHFSVDGKYNSDEMTFISSALANMKEIGELIKRKGIAISPRYNEKLEKLSAKVADQQKCIGAYHSVSSNDISIIIKPEPSFSLESEVRDDKAIQNAHENTIKNKNDHAQENGSLSISFGGLQESIPVPPAITDSKLKTLKSLRQKNHARRYGVALFVIGCFGSWLAMRYGSLIGFSVSQGLNEQTTARPPVTSPVLNLSKEEESVDELFQDAKTIYRTSSLGQLKPMDNPRAEASYTSNTSVTSNASLVYPEICLSNHSVGSLHLKIAPNQMIHNRTLLNQESPSLAELDSGINVCEEPNSYIRQLQREYNSSKIPEDLKQPNVTLQDLSGNSNEIKKDRENSAPLTQKDSQLLRKTKKLVPSSGSASNRSSIVRQSESSNGKEGQWVALGAIIVAGIAGLYWALFKGRNKPSNALWNTSVRIIPGRLETNDLAGCSDLQVKDGQKAVSLVAGEKQELPIDDGQNIDLIVEKVYLEEEVGDLSKLEEEVGNLSGLEEETQRLLAQMTQSQGDNGPLSARLRKHVLMKSQKGSSSLNSPSVRLPTEETSRDADGQRAEEDTSYAAEQLGQIFSGKNLNRLALAYLISNQKKSTDETYLLLENVNEVLEKQVELRKEADQEEKLEQLSVKGHAWKKLVLLYELNEHKKLKKKNRERLKEIDERCGREWRSNKKYAKAGPQALKVDAVDAWNSKVVEHVHTDAKELNKETRLLLKQMPQKIRDRMRTRQDAT